MQVRKLLKFRNGVLHPQSKDEFDAIEKGQQIVEESYRQQRKPPAVKQASEVIEQKDIKRVSLKENGNGKSNYPGRIGLHKAAHSLQLPPQ